MPAHRAGRAVGSFRAAAGLARLAGRRCCRLRHHGDDAFLWVLYIKDRGRHHRGDWGGSRAILPISLMAMSARGNFGFMSACLPDGRGPVLGGLMGGFPPPRSFFAAAALNGPNFLTGCFAGVAIKANAGRYAGGSQPASRFVPVPGHDRRRRPDGGLLHHATCLDRWCRPRLGHFRRRIAFTGTRPRSAFRLPHLAFCIHSPVQ